MRGRGFDLVHTFSTNLHFRWKFFAPKKPKKKEKKRKKKEKTQKKKKELERVGIFAAGIGFV
jgi:hypothetical protein